MPFCSWCRKTPDSLHVYNSDGTAGICLPCCSGLVNQIVAAQVTPRPEPYEGEERRIRAFPKDPFFRRGDE